MVRAVKARSRHQNRRPARSIGRQAAEEVAVGGIAKIPVSEPGEVDHILNIALDGLRYQVT